MSNAASAISVTPVNTQSTVVDVKGNFNMTMAQMMETAALGNP